MSEQPDTEGEPETIDREHPFFRAGFEEGQRYEREDSEISWDVIKSASVIRSRLIDSCAYALSELGAYDTSEVGDKVRAALGRLADRIEEDSA